MENYYLLTRLPGVLEENKERSRIWKQKMEFETQKKMENYYLLTLFPGLLEQKKRKEAEAWGVEKYIQDVKHRLTFFAEFVSRKWILKLYGRKHTKNVLVCGLQWKCLVGRNS